MTTMFDDILALGIILTFGVIIWAGFKKKPIGEVINDIKEFIKRDDDEE